MRARILPMLALLFGTALGPQYTTSTASTPSTCTSVTVSATLLAANGKRRGFQYCGKSTNTVIGHTSRAATATTSQTEVLPGACWGEDNTTYQGPLSFINDGSGTAAIICVEEW